MKNKSMTALVSMYARVWHSKHYEERIFSDCFGEKLISVDEYQMISNHMIKGIQFFNPNFTGSDEDALKWVMTHQLSPTPLGRGIYAERMLENAVRLGAQQYLIIAAGYDTFAYRQPEYGASLEIFEIDHPITLEDKQSRIGSVLTDPVENVHYIPIDLITENWTRSLTENRFFDSNKISYCSLLGISYYLKKETFSKLISELSAIFPEGSSLVFDYPDQDTLTDQASEYVKKQVMMAKAAGEPMQASYSEKEMMEILSNNGFLVYEHLVPDEITRQYFDKFNYSNPESKMKAFDNVNYCLAVKGK